VWNTFDYIFRYATKRKSCDNLLGVKKCLRICSVRDFLNDPDKIRVVRVKVLEVKIVCHLSTSRQ
jgi:hypothetical protein